MCTMDIGKEIQIQPHIEPHVEPNINTHFEPQVPYAHWGYRVGAALIDSIAESFALLVLTLFFASVSTLSLSAASQVFESLQNLFESNWDLFLDAVGKSYFVLSFLVAVLNRIVIQKFRGGSVGKLALGLRLELSPDAPGARKDVSFLRLIARYYASSLSTLILGIGYLMPLWTQKRQTLHDLICSTVVVKRF